MISFLLNNHDLPPLSNVYQPILPNVSRSITHLNQSKPVPNEKHVSVHVRPVYVSGLVNSSTIKF